MPVARTSTKQLIADSLEDLLLSKKLSSVTVAEIARNCGVSRQTFYRHFLDRSDLVCWIYYRDMMRYIGQVDDTYTWKDATLDSYRIIKKKQHFYTQAVQDPTQNSLSEFSFPKMLSECRNVIERLNPKIILDDNQLFALQFYFRGVIPSVQDWMKNGFKESPETVTERVIECMPRQIKTLLFIKE